MTAAVEQLPIAKTLTLSECGFNEYWLRDRIYEDPSILKLGELLAVAKEKTQSKGGRLDLLLKSSEEEMYEVELQLGETDESHIIRTIEYWDIEKQRWPDRSHTAVLLAEEITYRFYNVVHLLSKAIPIIGIQVKIVEVNGQRGLDFTKIIDSFESPEEEDPQQIVTEKDWADEYPGVLALIRWYKAMLERLYGEVPIKYFDHYVSLRVADIARVWINRRKDDRAFIEIKYGESDFDDAVNYLQSKGIEVRTRKNKYLLFNMTFQQLKEQAEIHEWIAKKLAPHKLINTARTTN